MVNDWTNIQEKYKGQWVALREDEETVAGSGKTAREALDKAKENGCAEPFMVRMPAELTTYIG